MDAASLTSEVLTVQEAMRIASMAVGVVFAYAAASKLLDVPGFVIGVRGYKVIPGRFAPMAAGLLIAGEGFIGLAHFAGIGLQFVVPGTIVLLSVFFVTMANSLRRGEKRPCLCFGASRDDLVDIYSLARVALLLAVEITLFFYLFLNDGSISTDAGDVYNSIVSVAIAVLTVILAGWCLALPKLYRAWHVVRS